MAGNNQIAVQKMASLKDYLGRVQPSIAAVLPKHMTAEKMIKIIQVAASRNHKLLDCSLQSIATSVVTASQLGLEPNSPLGHAYLVPYKSDAQLIIGYKGLVDLARRSGNISKIEAVVVHEGDTFKYTRGLHPDIIHEPSMALSDKPVMRAVYAIATYSTGEVQFEVMSRGEVDAIRNRSKSKDNGPWVTDYEEMAKKTVVKRLCKMLPMSVELANAVDLDNAQESGTAPIQIIPDAVIDTIEAEAAGEEVIIEPQKDKGDEMMERMSAEEEV